MTILMTVGFDLGDAKMTSEGFINVIFMLQNSSGREFLFDAKLMATDSPLSTPNVYMRTKSAFCYPL
jgi:hypothetical protein